jgi:hypothetical protein
MKTDPACSPGVLCNFVDNNLGGKYVARFNTVTDGYFETHSIQGDGSHGVERAGRGAQIYYNTLIRTAADGFSRPFFLRGGIGYVFHNTTTINDFSVNNISIDNVRSNAGPFGLPYGMCDGFSPIDGGGIADAGWPCRDQIGRSTDQVYWDNSLPAPLQRSEPHVYWKNTSPAGEQMVALNDPDPNGNMLKQIVANRDYYQYQSPFNETTRGVGEGTVAERPATCIAGVYYWTTDLGEWNSTNGIPDGELYLCSASGTWERYYMPYPYPHPLQN